MVLTARSWQSVVCTSHCVQRPIHFALATFPQGCRIQPTAVKGREVLSLLPSFHSAHDTFIALLFGDVVLLLRKRWHCLWQ